MKSGSSSSRGCSVGGKRVSLESNIRNVTLMQGVTIFFISCQCEWGIRNDALLSERNNNYYFFGLEIILKQIINLTKEI